MIVEAARSPVLTPAEVPPGDPAALRAAAGRVLAAADGIETTRSRLAAVSVASHRWTGAGADAFRPAATAVGTDMRFGSEGLRGLAGAIRAYADDLAAAQEASRSLRGRVLSHDDAVRRRAALLADSRTLPADVLDQPLPVIAGPSAVELDDEAHVLVDGAAEAAYQYRQAVRRAAVAFEASAAAAPPMVRLRQTCVARPHPPHRRPLQAIGLFALTGLLAMADGAQLGADPLTDGLTATAGMAGARALTGGADHVAAERAAGSAAGLPHGFTDKAEFDGFGAEVHRGLVDAGFPEAEAALQGSAVTGVKFTTGEPFDVSRTSDFDVAVAGDRLLERAVETGVTVRRDPMRTAPLQLGELRRLGLLDLQRSLSARMGREVHFMVFGDLGSAVGRGPSVVLPKP